MNYNNDNNDHIDYNSDNSDNSDYEIENINDINDNDDINRALELSLQDYEIKINKVKQYAKQIMESEDEYYKSLNGSNTFSWCLRNLRVPYKNRFTKRYLIKNDNGEYEVRLANPSNWVVKEY